MKYAVLIDSENAQPKMDDIFKELSKYGDTPIRYLIGDFTKPQVSPWLEVCKKNAITCIQTMNFTNGKNSLDISLVIEGMKILYEKDFIDGLIIVASDSDYTPLAREWRNAGKDVIGIGRKNSTESYRSSCNSFIYTENIYGGDIDNASINLTSTSKIAEIMDSVLNDNNGKVLLSIVVSAVRKAYSDFDVRNYGYQKAIDFFKGEFDHVELIKEDQRTYSIQFKHLSDDDNKKAKRSRKPSATKALAKEEALDKVEAIKEAKEPKGNTRASAKKEVKKEQTPKKASSKAKKGTKNKEAKLDNASRGKVLSIFKSFNKDKVSINDFGQELSDNNIKCQAYGFTKLKDMLASLNDFKLDNDMISLKDGNVKKAYVEEIAEDIIDF